MCSKKTDGITVTLTLDENDQPVLEFVHSEKDASLEQKLLGSLIRNIGRQGLELHRTGGPAGQTLGRYRQEIKPALPHPGHTARNPKRSTAGRN